MKKINVTKLIEIRTREKSAEKNLKVYSELALKNSSWEVDRKNELQKLADCRKQFEAEAEALTQAIADAEGNRTSARKIDAQDIIDDLIEINDYLGITKKSMKGTTARVDHNAQSFPGAYKGTPESTHFSAEFTTNWFVTSIGRDTCTSRKYNIKLSEAAKEEYLRNAETLK